MQNRIPAFVTTVLIYFSFVSVHGHALRSVEAARSGIANRQNTNSDTSKRAFPDTPADGLDVVQDGDYTLEILVFGPEIETRTAYASLIAVLVELANRGTPTAPLISQRWHTEYGPWVDFTVASRAFQHNLAFKSMFYIGRRMLTHAIHDSRITVKLRSEVLGVFTIAQANPDRWPPITLDETAIAPPPTSLAFTRNETRWEVGLGAQIFNIELEYDWIPILDVSCMENILAAMIKLAYMALDAPLVNEFVYCEFITGYKISFSPEASSVPFLHRHILIALSLTARKIFDDGAWKEWSEVAKLNGVGIGKGRIGKLDPHEERLCHPGSAITDIVVN